MVSTNRPPDVDAENSETVETLETVETVETTGVAAWRRERSKA